jgi:hypothetical protein
MTALPAKWQSVSSNGVGAALGAIPGASWSAKIGNSETRPYQLQLFLLKCTLTSVIVGGVGGHGLFGNADPRTRSR